MSTFPEPAIIGRSPAIRKVVEITRQVGDLDLNVLITGESGVGKELIARSLHYHAQRRRKPFVKVNAAALPAQLIESELFGYEKGAFTGAQRSKIGKFETAGEGTLFLDEIGEMSTLTQSKLLQVLQDREYSRVGGHQPQQVKARVIAATNRDLDAEMQNGHFRADLFYRLSTISIHVPPLRQRKEDLQDLIEHLLGLQARDLKQPIPALPDDLLELFQEHHWPGNVRELSNYLQRFSVFGSSREIKTAIQAKRRPEDESSVGPQQPEPAYPEPRGNPDGSNPAASPFPSLRELRDQIVQRVEKSLIQKALLDSNWNRRQTARKLNISYRSLMYKMKAMDINQAN
jgi:transcriptional regulator with PAS, ATPase and Fis domain